MSGGDFRSGFLAGSFGAFGDVNGLTNNHFGAGLFGGIGAKLGGGNFAEGAVVAIVGHEFNERRHSRKAFERKYGDILSAGGIDIDHNVKDAASSSTKDWLGKVATGGDWDYKNNANLIAAGISPARLDDFGNMHFGIVARAHGFNLEGSLYGAGLYQVAKQGGGNSRHLAVATGILSRTYGGYLFPDSVSRLMTKGGFTWGDNPGDSINIMKGWDYANKNY